MADDVDAVMQTIPTEWRERWCGGEGGPCGCMGCVQIGNRLIMAGLRASQVDPEYIDETKIPADVYAKYKITKDEWISWMKRQPR
jgi:hypothetical protein